MTQFNRRKFSVPAPGTDEYRDNYEKTFGKKPGVQSHNPAVSQREAHAFAPGQPGEWCSICGAPAEHENHGGVIHEAGAVASAAQKHHLFTPQPASDYCSVCGWLVDHELHHQVQKDRAEAIELTEHSLILLVEVTDQVLAPSLGNAHGNEFYEFQQLLVKAQDKLADLRARVEK